MKKYLFIFLILILFISCGKKKEEANDNTSQESSDSSKSAVNVTVAAAGKTVVPDTFEGTGELDIVDEIVEYSRTSGDIVEIKYKNGDKVNANTHIMSISDTDINDDIDKVRSELIAAQNDYTAAVQNHNSDIERAKNNVIAANSAYALSKSTYDKYKKLYDEKLIAQIEIEQHQNNLIAAQENLKSAQTSLEFLQNNPTYASAKSRVEAAQINLNSLQKDARDQVVVAKLTGIITDLDRNPYEKVNKGELLFKIIDDSKLELIIGVPSNEIAKIKLGDPAIVVIEGVNQEIEGVVSEIASISNEQTKKFDISITIPNPDGRFKKGNVWKNKINHWEEEAVLIPKNGILIETLGNYIYVIDTEGRAKKVKVELGESLRDYQVILSPDMPDSFLVVTEGKYSLEDEDIVNIVKETSPNIPATNNKNNKEMEEKYEEETEPNAPTSEVEKN